MGTRLAVLSLALISTAAFAQFSNPYTNSYGYSFNDPAGLQISK